jgi:lipoprotein-anchoring transpeptidase ErfK/SrfK
VSTARRGYYTPRGSFRPKVLKRMHYSSKYENSPMPYSVFFHGGYAIHGTEYVRRLGSPASHGCIRLHTVNAAALYSLIKRYGRGSTRIRVVN